jgi:1-deoxy-D-xylulose-5-phosphate reductoisomerase
MIAQLGLPDMRTPISYAMRYPERMPLDLPSLDLTEVGTLTFCKPDHDRFPCLKLGYEALRIGGTMPAAMNAANEIAVDAFLNGGLRFVEIAEVVRSTMDAHTPLPVERVEDALEADRWARDKAESLVHALPR